jgi:hypothetical protein
MLKDTLNSVLDNIKERTTNPFLGTLLVIWTIRNWSLVYALFTFNPSSNLHSRLSYIQQHFDHQSFYCNMLMSIGITMVVLLVTYIFLAISRLLTDSYDKLLLPQIAKVTDKSSVVLKSEYTALQEAFKLLEGRLEEERLAKVSAQKERDSTEERLIAALSNLNIQNSSSNNANLQTAPSSFIRVSTKAKRVWTTAKFNNYLTNINNGTLLQSGDDIMKTLIRENFIVPGGRSTSSGQDYKLTEEGMAFLKYWNDLAEDENSEVPE